VQAVVAQSQQVKALKKEQQTKIQDLEKWLTTDAPVVHYNPDLTVNGFHNENSFTRLTLKENNVQQVAKDIQDRIVTPDVASLKSVDVKLDTSNIIMNEINTFNVSDNESTNNNEQQKSLSLIEEEIIGG